LAAVEIEEGHGQFGFHILRHQGYSSVRVFQGQPGIHRPHVLHILFTKLQIFLGSLVEKLNQVVSILFFEKTDIHLPAIVQVGQFMVTSMIKHVNLPNSLSVRAQLTALC
jgi:hypothetical protein